MKWMWMPKERKKMREGMEGKKEEVVKVRDVVQEVERHYRGLARKEELAG